MKRAIAILLAAILVSAVCPSSADGRTRSEKDEKQGAARIKSAILQLGAGPAAYIELKLTDGTKLKGYVDEAREEHFVVVDAKSGESHTVSYGQVKKIKGNNLSTGAKVAIGVGVGLAVLLLILKDRIEGH